MFVVLIAVLLGGAVVVACLFSFLWVKQCGRASDYLGLGAVLVWLCGSAGKVYFDRHESADGIADMLETMQSVSWSRSRSTVDAVGSSVTGAAPVDSLIGGLEARLAAQPNDRDGWALLAQSYSFVGDSAAAERAVQRAVELGFVETDLRRRVDSARRHSSVPSPASTGG